MHALTTMPHNFRYWGDVFMLLLAPSGLTILFAWFAPETLPKPQNRRHMSLVEGSDFTPSDEDAAALSSRRRCDGKLCSTCRLLASPQIAIISVFVFLFVLGGSSLLVCKAFMTIQFGWTSTQSTALTLVGGVVALVSLLGAGWIVPRLGSLFSMLASAVLATVGLGLMCLAPFSWLLFLTGLICLCISAFGSVAFQQFISARVDPARMGALQAALSACAMVGVVLGSNFFTFLFVWLDEERWAVFGAGAGIMAVACGLVLYLYVTLKPAAPGSIGLLAAAEYELAQ